MDTDIRLKKLLNKYLRDRCTEREIHLLFDYLKRAEHEPEIKQMLSAYWEDIDENERFIAADHDYDEQAWFDEIYSKAVNKEKKPDSKSSLYKEKSTGHFKTFYHKRQSFFWLKIAAILLVTATFSYLFYIYQHNISQTPELIQKIAADGEKVRFVLPDGTQVHLNSESKLTFPSTFSDSTRNVQLQGEGFFIVTHDAVRPFQVSTKDITTKVLGTSFSIRSYPEDNQAVVAVRSGKVSVTEAGAFEEQADVILEPNEYANYSFANRQFTTGEGITAYTAWNSGILLYNDKELGEVAYQLERWYGVDIHFENETIKTCVVRGEHRDESLTNVLEAITYAFDMEYKIEGRTVLLTGQGCN